MLYRNSQQASLLQGFSFYFSFKFSIIFTITSSFDVAVLSSNSPFKNVAKNGKLSTAAILRANSFSSAFTSKKVTEALFSSFERRLYFGENNLHDPHQSA